MKRQKSRNPLPEWCDESFEFVAWWKQPGSSAPPVPGRITHEPGQDIILELYGDISKSSDEQPVPFLVGQTPGSGKATLATIEGAYLTSGGPAFEERQIHRYICDGLYTWIHTDSDGQMPLKSIVVEFSGLTEWIMETDSDAPTLEELAQELQNGIKTEIIARANWGDTCVEISRWREGSYRGGSLNVETRTNVSIQPLCATSPQTFRSLVRQFQSLFEILLGPFQSIEVVQCMYTLFPNQGHPPHPRDKCYYIRGWASKQARRALNANRSESIVNFQTVKEYIPEILRRWHAPVSIWNIAIHLKESRSTIVIERQLEAAGKGLEAFFKGPWAHQKSFSKTYVNKSSQVQRLQALVNNAHNEVSILFEKGWCELFKECRNELTHPEANTHGLPIRELSLMGLMASLLLHYHTLVYLGLSEDKTVISLKRSLVYGRLFENDNWKQNAIKNLYKAFRDGSKP